MDHHGVEDAKVFALDLLSVPENEAPRWDFPDDIVGIDGDREVDFFGGFIVEMLFDGREIARDDILACRGGGFGVDGHVATLTFCVVVDAEGLGV
ncbi:Uncharacterised protein [Mycobacterium tuberculosis]|nr:Uncharacterised protein [Mycobacterium tuberculosis]